MSNLIGVILCGGQSQRMGTDKGLIPINGNHWATFTAKKLENLALPVLVSINQKQYPAYKTIFPDIQLIIDKTPITGPLNGLLSVHDTYPQNDLLLMACDLIDMDERTLKKLIQVYQTEPNFDFYVYRYDHFTEPFCAIYTSKGLARVYNDFRQNKMNSYSLHQQFESGNTKYITSQSDKAFRNYNNL